eukprot:2043959-Rhodomonas_salina.2
MREFAGLFCPVNPACTKESISNYELEALIRFRSARTAAAPAQALALARFRSDTDRSCFRHRFVIEALQSCFTHRSVLRQTRLAPHLLGLATDACTLHAHIAPLSASAPSESQSSRSRCARQALSISA